MSENPFYVVRLFNLYTNTDGIDRWFDKDLFVLISGYMHGIQDNLRGRPDVKTKNM